MWLVLLDLLPIPNVLNVFSVELDILQWQEVPVFLASQDQLLNQEVFVNFVLLDMVIQLQFLESVLLVLQDGLLLREVPVTNVLLVNNPILVVFAQIALLDIVQLKVAFVLLVLQDTLQKLVVLVFPARLVNLHSLVVSVLSVLLVLVLHLLLLVAIHVEQDKLLSAEDNVLITAPMDRYGVKPILSV